MFGCSIFASGSDAHWQSALSAHLSLVRMRRRQTADPTHADAASPIAGRPHRLA
jgi:hypothetical protein